MEQGQIPPQQQGSWPTWQQQPGAPPQQGGGQSPYGYAPYGHAPPQYGWNQHYAAQVAQMKAPPEAHPKELPWRLAGWWSRAGAQILDLLIVWVPASIVLVVLIALAESARNGSTAEAVWLGVTILASFLALGVHFFYAPLLMKRKGRRNGQSWGKQAAGIRVIRADGREMSFADAALRQIVYKSFGGIVASSLIPLFPWILDYLWPTWDEQRRALHDIAADTRVVSA
jgi:uncharacterized RDD family membrane protein YckC